MQQKITKTPHEASLAHMLEDVAQLYGEDLAPGMAALTRDFEPVAAAVADRYYWYLGQIDDSRDLIQCLSESELNHLKQRQIENLLQLTSPTLTEPRP